MLCFYITGHSQISKQYNYKNEESKLTRNIPKDDISDSSLTDESEKESTINYPVTDSLTSKKKNFIQKIIHYFSESNVDKSEKKFDFSIIGGPHYSSDTKLGIGVVAAGLFRADKEDLMLPPSDVSLYGDVTTTGYYLLGLRGHTYFKGGKYQLNYKGYFFSMPSKFFGLGYQNGMDDNYTKYLRLENQINIDFLYRIFRNGYIGTNVSFNYGLGKKFNDISFLEAQNKEYINTGVGLMFEYDSRDFIPNPFKGLFFKFDQRAFPKQFGNKKHFLRTEIFFDVYKQLWTGSVLAFDFHTLLNYGGNGVPWTMDAAMGGSYRMRGYYEGRFRDRCLSEVQLELRQKIWKRNGIVVWAGAGNVYSSLTKFSFRQTLPNYGIGYRWEFKKRINVRLDYGFGKNGQSGFIFGINEAF